MRQAIKGDGTDGTAALKAYLLEHDEVLAQELYEFTRPRLFNFTSVRPPVGNVVQYGELINDYGGLGLFNTWVPLSGQIFAGDILFAFMYNADGGSAPGILDTAGHVWHLIYSNTNITVWYAIATARSVGTLTGWGGPVLASDIVKFSTGANGANSEFFVVEVSAVGVVFPNNGAHYASGPYTLTAGASTVTATTGFSIPADMVIIELVSGSLCLGFFINAHPTDVTPLAEGAASEIFFIAPSGLSTSPAALPARVCDASSPLTYAGDVYAPANLKNDGFKSKIGLDVDSLQLSWTFRGDEPMVTDPDTGAIILTMLQGFQQGLWAGVWVKWWRVYMPTFGDCDSLGAVRMFRGRIGPVEVDRLTAKITVNSVTEMFNRQVPQQLIEANNRSGQVGPGLPPDLDADPTHWTYFECVTGHGGTMQKIVAQQTAPTADEVYAPGTFDLGYLLFQASPLDFFVAQVQHYEVIGVFNVFYLFKPLYVDPHAYGLTFIAFIPIPKDQDVSGAGGVELKGFKRVPLPEQAV
jgi:Uncharacterized conserved protein (DUF2163)